MNAPGRRRNIPGTFETALHPWPADSRIQGNDTALGAHAAGAATTAQFEAYVLDHEVIRGFGPTVRAAEADAWAQYQLVFGPEILRTGETSVHAWPAGCYLQGGKSGLVIGGADGHYTTAFVEAFPRDPNTFIRGEGATVAEADAAAWAKYQRFLACDGHEFRAGKYTNGAGHCAKCGMFASKVFTALELGQFCATCATPTMWTRAGDNWFCEDHAPSRQDALVANDAAGVKVGVLERLLTDLDEEEVEA